MLVRILVASPIRVATGTLHRLFEMKQIICLLILLIGVLNTQGTPIHIGIGGGGSVNTGGLLENLPPSIVSGAGGIVNEIIGSGSSSTSEASVPAESSEPAVPVEVPESSSIPAESSEPSVPVEPSESSSVAAESSETSVPVQESESSSASAASTEASLPPSSEASSVSSIPAETSPSPASSSSTETSAPSESAGSEVTKPENSTTTETSAPSESTESEVTSEPENSTTSESTESTGNEQPTETESPESTTPASENPNTCLGSCPAVDSYDSVYLVNERCDKFCQCSNGRAIVLSCPDGLHFNRVLNVCDWPINAKCARLAILNK